MKYILISLAVIFSINVFASCKKSGVNEQVELKPSNMLLTETISSNGSGKVDFSVTAQHATSFTFEFGDGQSEVSTTGITSYTYTNEGTFDYNVIVTAKSASGLTASVKKTIRVKVDAAARTLYWSDEFENTGAPDGSKWGYDIGTGSNGWGNAELQYYTNRSENVYVNNGTLKIKAIKENYSGSAYTSTRLLSKSKFEFKYGKIEVRAKVPAAVGTWPAVWMLGADFPGVVWPNCGEIDIIEHRGSELNKIVGALHYPDRFGSNANTNSVVIENAATAFHVYSVDWSTSSIKFYVDDRLYHSVTNSSSIPYNKNFFFLINLAMGGGFGGPVDPQFTNEDFEVDYIRVYK